MFRSPINYLFISLILLIFTSTRVSSDCSNQRTCYSGFSTNTWCCDWSDTCGSYDDLCENNTVLSTTLIAVIIIGSIFFFILCLTCCLRSYQRQERIRTAYMNSNAQIVTNPYQQQVVRGPVRVVHVRPVYNISSAPPPQQYPSLYEAPPPSYESVVASLPTVHEPSASPRTPTAQ